MPTEQAHVVTPTEEPQWVSEMHAYFWEHGFYRAEDLQRVLGDPKTVVERSTDDVSFDNFVAFCGASAHKV